MMTRTTIFRINNEAIRLHRIIRARREIVDRFKSRGLFDVANKIEKDIIPLITKIIKETYVETIYNDDQQHAA